MLCHFPPLNAPAGRMHAYHGDDSGLGARLHYLCLAYLVEFCREQLYRPRRLLGCEQYVGAAVFPLIGETQVELPH
jgi:hypothetical protein